MKTLSALLLMFLSVGLGAAVAGADDNPGVPAALIELSPPLPTPRCNLRHELVSAQDLASLTFVDQWSARVPPLRSSRARQILQGALFTGVDCGQRERVTLTLLRWRLTESPMQPVQAQLATKPYSGYRFKLAPCGDVLYFVRAEGIGIVRVVHFVSERVCYP